MIQQRGVVIYPQEVSEYWNQKIFASSINLLGIHPPGGPHTEQSIRSAQEALREPAVQSALAELRARGIGIEYEMHALSWLLPRSLFSMHPEWFRMDEKGERTPDYNLCPSNRDALDYIAERAAILARTFRPTTGRHHFWLDDNAHSRCHCRDCARLSASDAAMLTYNAIARGVRGADPDARQCYLAYADTLEPPRRVEPADNIFLEYAPFYRDLHRPLTDPENAAQIQPIDELLRVFGARGAEALDYWLDNSYLSDWKEPPQRFVLEPEVIHADMALYEDKGFETVTSFACYLGEDYAKLYRENPDLSFL